MRHHSLSELGEVGGSVVGWVMGEKKIVVSLVKREANTEHHRVKAEMAEKENFVFGTAPGSHDAERLYYNLIRDWSE